MKPKILWLPRYRGLDEMIERKYNIISRLDKESSCSLILFNGTHFEENMFEELLRFYVDGQAGLEDVFSRIRKHYNRVIRSLDQESEDLKEFISKNLNRLEKLIHQKVSEPEVCVRDQLQSIQLLMGSKIAFAMLELADWTWMDSAELFRIDSDEIRHKPTEEEIQMALKEVIEGKRCKVMPVLTQSGIISTADGNIVVFKLEDEIMDAAKKAKIEIVKV
ncbi:MAG: hypothetical protein EA362_07760 [Saprospirales bacterium]|nr:MAG: hypothetical protein EA362_07760 [Saprospirales bacterium]